MCKNNLVYNIRNNLIRSFLTLLLLMCATITFAHDIAVKNSDGKTIYYKYNSDGTSVSVTYLGSSSNDYSNEYSGEIVIPETITYSDKTYSVTSIGSGAFYWCSGLTSVTIPNSVTSIGVEAFSSCYGLISVTIPNSVTSIGYRAFDSCSGLTSVTIPNSVTSIDAAFDDCRRLTSVIWNAKNYPAFSISSGPFYDIRTQITEFIIGDEVTSIPAYMFDGMSNLKSVTIPNSVTSIDAAFDDCSGLEKVIVPNFDIKNWCSIKFGYYSNPLRYAHHLYSDENTEITELVIPNSVTSIGSYAFSGCSGLKSVTIPNSVTSIGSYAFSGCSGLTSVTIGNSVTSIGDRAFYNTRIKSLTIGSGIQTIASDAFGYYSSDSGAKPVKVIWLANTPPSGYKNVGGTINYVPNDSYSGLSGQKIYPFLSSMFEVDGIKYVPVSPSERTCDAIDCVYNESAENTKIGNTVTYKNINMTVQNVGDSICKDNTFIKELEFSYNGGILSKIFSGCSNITSITIGSGVKRMIESAFSDCKNTTSVMWNAKNYPAFSSYSSNPFYNIRTQITEFIMGDEVTSIPAYMCYGMSNLKSINIPDGVTSIGESAFYNCSGLKKVIVPDIKNWCSIKFGSSSANPLYYAHHLYNDDNTEITKLVIPDDVTSINSYAFSGCSGLTSVTIPNSVTSIGSYAFQACSGLTSVTIPNNVTSIGSYAFYECSGLTSITIPNSVTSIGSYAFYKCSGLKKVIVPDIENWCSIGFGDYYSNPLQYAHHLYSDVNTEITKLVIPDGVTSIGSDAFSGCSGLTSVTIPSSVTSIGKKAFDGCSGLTSVTIPNSVTSIGSSAFYNCSGLKKVIVPDIKNWCSIKFGENYANPLYYAHHLYSDENTEITELIIPDGVVSIGSSAFYACSSLTSVTIPNSVTSIGSSAFYGCSGLKSITWNAKNYPAFSSYSSNPFYNIRTQITEFIIGDDMTSIPSYMCYEMSNLKSVTIPNSVTSIGSDAFSGCSGLTSVTIPNSVTSIGSYAFLCCSGLTSVTIPNSVTSIGYAAFQGCNGLKKVIVPNFNIKNWCSIKFGSSSANPLYYAHHLYSDENMEITKLVIPDDVTSIGSSAFSGCSGLTSVTIPNSVTSIGSSAFYGCSGLTSVTIPNSVTSIGGSAFSGCLGLTSVTIPNSVISIGSDAFEGCSGLTSVAIGNSVTRIGSTIFSGCSSLTSVRFENSKDNTPIVLENNKVFSDCPLDEVYIGRKLSYTTTSSAGYSPFYKKTTLRSVKFTDKETEISDYEFYGCTNLTDVSMGDGVKSIGAYAFSGCSSLEHFTCGRQLESIGKEAFSDCTSMTKFKTRAAVPPTCGAQALDDINKWECTLYVPTESIDDYQAADQWKNFFFIEKFNLQGDSNGDDVVNAKDYSGVASYIMGDTPEEFDVEASDVDENGAVDVRDYVGIANIITTGSIFGGTNNNAKAAMSKGSAMPVTDESDAENVIYVEDVSGSKNSQVELSVRMKNASDIRGFQFDLYLPEGVTIANNAKASLSSDRLAAGDAHTLMADEMTDGAVRFLCSSMNDESFAGGDGEIATLTVNIADNMANGDYDVVVKNALMTETDISRSYEADDIKSTLTVLDQTGVETVTADNERRDGTIYTVGGQLVGKKSTTSQLRKGIYIRNGKKIVVK